MLSLSKDKLAAITGAAFAGIATGCLTFVSAVDVRSFLSHVNRQRTDLIQTHFSVWWPAGRDLMVPILGMGTLSNFMAFRLTQNAKFAWAAAAMALIGPYTGIVLGEDIEALRQSKPADVAATARRFCNLHHFRLVLAAAGFGMALVGLAEL